MRAARTVRRPRHGQRACMESIVTFDRSLFLLLIVHDEHVSRNDDLQGIVPMRCGFCPEQLYPLAEHFDRGELIKHEIVARAAARRMDSQLPAPIQSGGWGTCFGNGSTTTFLKRQKFPSYENRSRVVHAFRMISSPSSKRGCASSARYRIPRIRYVGILFRSRNRAFHPTLDRASRLVRRPKWGCARAAPAQRCRDE